MVLLWPNTQTRVFRKVFRVQGIKCYLWEKVNAAPVHKNLLNQKHAKASLWFCIRNCSFSLKEYWTKPSVANYELYLALLNTRLVGWSSSHSFSSQLGIKKIKHGFADEGKVAVPHNTCWSSGYTWCHMPKSRPYSCIPFPTFMRSLQLSPGQGQLHSNTKGWVSSGQMGTETKYVEIPGM